MLSKGQLDTLRETVAILKGTSSQAIEEEAPWFLQCVQELRSEESDDEEAPPDDSPLSFEDGREMAMKASAALSGNQYERAYQLASKALKVNANSVRALRVRAHALCAMSKWKDALPDFVLAQQIDFDEDTARCHEHCATLVREQPKEEEITTDAVPPPQKTNMPQLPQGIDIAAIMSNPVVQQAAQSLMNNPEAMKSFMNMKQ